MRNGQRHRVLPGPSSRIEKGHVAGLVVPSERQLDAATHADRVERVEWEKLLDVSAELGSEFRRGGDRVGQSLKNARETTQFAGHAG